jgi:DNA-binding NtrC family response regulator
MRTQARWQGPADATDRRGFTVTERARILVVDDDREVVEYLREILTDDGHRVEGTTDPHEGLACLERASFDLVLSDVEMPRLRGTELMHEIHRRKPDQLVILITAFGSIDSAVKAVRAGASDFITKPFRHEILQVAIERALRERRMRREIVRLRSASQPPEDGSIIARSSKMKQVVNLAARVAPTESIVLLTGESGVGKGLVARFIHDRSKRSGAPFEQINCAAIPAPIAEAELFGARRGAYTGAEESRAGVFAAASGGTLFLDEIGEMPLEVQAKVLHAIETGRIRPVGSDVEEQVDARLVVATNRPLESAVREQRFREDLYYRLNVVRIEIPPLRERGEDIQALVDALLERACARAGREVLAVSEEAMRWILSYHWPGNVRELANTLERAVVMTDHDALLLEDLLLPELDSPDSGFLQRAARKGLSLADIELEYIRAVVDVAGGNKSEAAKILGIDRRTLYRRLEGDR